MRKSLPVLLVHVRFWVVLKDSFRKPDAYPLGVLLGCVPINGGIVQDLQVDEGHLLSAPHALIPQ